jgi:hypothetical protein
MRTPLQFVALIMVAIGLVWFFQGINVLPGSFMTGDPKWAVIGGIVAACGAGLLAYGRRT